MDLGIPTIIIGLGGTGLKTVVSLKNKLANFRGVLVKFICIDSDKNEVLVKKLDPDEYINIGVPGVSAIVSNLKLEAAEYIRPWFPSNLNFKIVSGDEGAKQFRPMGRLYLFKNVDKVFNALDMATKQLRAKFAEASSPSKTINVYIISSVCGGTGSGMLLDIAYIVREVVEVENACSALIKGVLFLPTAFSPFPISDVAERNHIYANGYATLKEIDYFMSPNKETEFVANYSHTRSIRNKKPPFDVCYLIDDENEEFPIGSLEDTIDAVSESLIILLSSGLGTSIKSAEDNLFTVLSGIQNMQPYSDKNYMYSSFGTSSIIYPYEQVKRYVSGNLVKFMFDSLNQEVKYSQVVEMMKYLKIDETESDDLLESLYNYRPTIYTEIVDQILQVSNKNLQSFLKGKLHVDYENMVQEIKSKIDQTMDSLISSKFEELKNLIQEYIKSTSRGFFWTYNLLTDMDKGFFGYIEKVKEILRKEIEQHNLTISKLKSRVDTLQEAIIEKSNNIIFRILNRKDRKLIFDYARSLYELYNNIVQKTLKEYAITFYTKLSILVQRYVDDEISRIYSVWERFYKDYVSKYLSISFSSRLTSWGNRINFYVASKEVIDKNIKMIIENEKTKIISQLYRIFDNFIGMKYEKIATYDNNLLDFIEQNYRDYLYVDIEDQVIREFGSEDVVINRLTISSSVLYRYRPQLFNESYVKYYKVLGVKNVNNSKFFNISKVQNIEVIENYNPFRISMLQVKHGLPLYAFVMIEPMENAYLELIASDPGLHIDPHFQKFDNLTIDYELSTKDYEKYLYIYLALNLGLVYQEGISFIININENKMELGNSRNEVIDSLYNKLKDESLMHTIAELVNQTISNKGFENVQNTIKEHLQKIKNRINYLNNKKNVTKDEMTEKDYLEQEYKVLKKFIETTSLAV
ncbi:MAG: tubulin-like doman-containing protein [bacterium]